MEKTVRPAFASASRPALSENGSTMQARIAPFATPLRLAAPGRRTVRTISARLECFRGGLRHARASFLVFSVRKLRPAAGSRPHPHAAAETYKFLGRFRRQSDAMLTRVRLGRDRNCNHALLRGNRLVRQTPVSAACDAARCQYVLANANAPEEPIQERLPFQPA